MSLQRMVTCIHKRLQIIPASLATSSLSKHFIRPLRPASTRGQEKRFEILRLLLTRQRLYCTRLDLTIVHRPPDASPGACTASATKGLFSRTVQGTATG